MTKISSNIIFLMLVACYSPDRKTNNDLDDITKREIITQLCQEITDKYVFEDKAYEIKNHFLLRLPISKTINTLTQDN